MKSTGTNSKITFEKANRFTKEDWTLVVNGEWVGYMYNCDQGDGKYICPVGDTKEEIRSGWAVGVRDSKGKIKHVSVKQSKKAALAFARKHIAELFR